MINPIATIYIPFSEVHKPLVHRAYQSAIEQTVKCKVVTGLSAGTPAHLRNEAFKAETPFVCFLDADDTLEPTFLEQCLRTYQTGRYVYTSWYQGETIMRPAPCDPYLAHDFKDGRGLIGGYHLVTTLFPTSVFKASGGFDPELPGMEDTDLYMRTHRAGYCGILCDKPLVHYSGDDNSRAKDFMKLPDYDDMRRAIVERNGGIGAMAGCCGISGGGVSVNTTGEQPGDIVVETLYAPTTQYGRVPDANGNLRFYPRPLYMGQRIKVSPADAEAMPHLFRKVQDLSEVVPKRDQVLKEAGLL